VKRTPRGIFATHPADQVADFAGKPGSSRLAPPNPPAPEQTKAPAMPGNHRLGLNNDQRAGHSKCGTARPIADGPEDSTSRVFLRNAAVRRFGAAEPGPPAQEQRANARSGRVASSVATNIGRENYEGSLPPILSHRSRFSRGTGTQGTRHCLVVQPLGAGQHHTWAPSQGRLAARSMGQRLQPIAFLVGQNQRLFGSPGSHLSLLRLRCIPRHLDHLFM